MTRKRLLTSAAALAGVGIAGVWLMAHRPVKLLPYGSIRIASTASWKEMLVRSMPIIPPKEYFWTSQGEILHPEFDPAAPGHNPREWNVPAPPRSIRGQILLSPHGDRILWIVDKQESLFSYWTARLRLGNKSPSRGDQGIYVSRLDGGGMKELCSTPAEHQQWGRLLVIKRSLSDIHWLPDDRRISFIYKNDLYLAPVD